METPRSHYKYRSGGTIKTDAVNVSKRLFVITLHLINRVIENVGDVACMLPRETIRMSPYMLARFPCRSCFPQYQVPVARCLVNKPLYRLYSHLQPTTPRCRTDTMSATQEADETPLKR